MQQKEIEMKKLMTTFSVATLAFVMIFSTVVLAQPGQGGNENQILVSINRAELSLEQLQMLQGLTESTIAAQAEVTAAQEALNQFLVDFSGTSEEFDVALEAEQAKVQAAREAVLTLRVANADIIKDNLTASQFEALERTLSDLMAEAPTPRGQGGPDGDNANADGNDGPNNGPGNNNQGPQGQQGGNNNGPDRDGPGNNRGGGGNNLDTLLEALNEKIAALQAA